MEITDRGSSTLVRLPMFYDLGAQVEVVIDQALAYFTAAGGQA